ncbi:hypothetical protein AQUCO_01100475v1 [Aquilegia coerulea]|uniref:Uncharacterized protein n=1 Tax=Aquilegia coerulea TaxID=218851 RepID=A0A2G5E7A9_AQUCA|nr:hypothetical protein AQUCO_01100475v1 [Aquilegia coerulea]
MSETTSKLKKNKKNNSPCPSTKLDLKRKPTTSSSRNPLKDLKTTTITKTRSNTRTFNYTSSSSSSNVSSSSSNLTSSLSIDSPKGCLRFFLPNSKNPPSKFSKRTPKSAPISKPRCKPPISNKSQRTPFVNKSQNDKDLSFGNFEHTPNPKSSLDLKECGSESLQWSFSRMLIEGNCDDDDDRTPAVRKKECESGLDEKETTPPVQASISPEIQCGSSFTSGKSTCFGAGHVLSGIPDKRKCRARGILAVEEEKELGLFEDGFSIDDKSFQGFSDSSRLSLIPAPIDASMHWLSPPRNIEENDQKESFQNGSTPFPSPSSSSSYGHGFSTDTCNSNSTSNTTATGKNVCLVSPTAHLDFGLWGSEAEMSNEKRGYQFETPDTKISPSSAGDCACLVSPSAHGEFEGHLRLKALMSNEEREQCNEFLAEKISPSSGGDSLGSYNAVCTPQSESSLEDCVVGLSWFKNANYHAAPSVSPKNRTSTRDPADADVLPLPGFSFQFTHPTRPSTPLQKTSNDRLLDISSASYGSSLQSHMRISWRDEIVSGTFEMDDLDCCRLLSDDEEEDISCKVGANLVENDAVPNGAASEQLETEKQQCNVSVFEKSNACAESINAEGGYVNTSRDSDWNLCYKD